MEKFAPSEVAETRGGNNSVKAITAMVFLAILGSGVLVCTGKPAKLSCEVDAETIQQASRNRAIGVYKDAPSLETSYVVRIPMDVNTFVRSPLLPDRIVTFSLGDQCLNPFDEFKNSYDVMQDAFNERVRRIILQCEEEVRRKTESSETITVDLLDKEASIREECLREKGVSNLPGGSTMPFGDLGNFGRSINNDL